MNNQFTTRVTHIIQYSKEEANRLRSPYIGSEHLLLGILREGTGKAYESLFNLQINPDVLKKAIDMECRNRLTPTDELDVNFNDEASRILKLCILEAKLQKCRALGCAMLRR